MGLKVVLVSFLKFHERASQSILRKIGLLGTFWDTDGHGFCTKVVWNHEQHLVNPKLPSF